MKNKVLLWLCMMFAWVAMMAQSTSDLLPLPQQVKTSGGTFVMGKVALETPVLQSEWMDFVQNGGGEVVEKSSKKIVVKLLPEIAEAKQNQEEAYRMKVSTKGVQIEATTETSLRFSPCALAFASRSGVQNASYSFLNLSKISSTDAVQYIWYVSGRIIANTFSGVKP